MINELIIVNESGLALFYQNLLGKIPKEYQQIAAFFTALNTFASAGAVNDEVKMISTEKSIFKIIKRDEFSFIFSCSKRKIDESKLNTTIRRIVEEFLNEFNKEINRFNGDISIFDSFSENIEKICNIKTKKPKKSSEILKNFLGINDKKIDYKKVLNSL
ncbi:MAG: hypothetical protein GF329_02545 [Candidatus Lokiarchaeota archaeon]|nr:hypothetical protein [Candidatus Lokiarchaeota archaeon]